MSEEKKELALATPNAIAELMKAEGPGKYATENALSNVSKVGDWLPYIVLHSSSAAVKKKEIEGGHFGLHPSKGTIIDLGASFVALFLAWRPKAMQYKPKVLSFYDSTSKEFKDVEERAKNTKDSGCGVGPEFLVWLPDQRKFATYFLGNKTGRNESPNITGPLEDKGPFLCVQNAKLIEMGEYMWHGPETKKHDIPLSKEQQPILAELKEQLHKFNNPDPVQEEVADEADDKTRR